MILFFAASALNAPVVLASVEEGAAQLNDAVSIVRAFDNALDSDQSAALEMLSEDAVVLMGHVGGHMSEWVTLPLHQDCELEEAAIGNGPETEGGRQVEYVDVTYNCSLSEAVQNQLMELTYVVEGTEIVGAVAHFEGDDE
ncbi:hypothetical protein [uncultured Parasphingopyxis sp.]|uniref:hypothetical protein n=1 Tax=uncultured Parasphingopyxis sp. TaxID=1547918 RepID=UPI0026205AF3|nr:hypothetical protein [uncultured Parasphingopyxis sp.]